MSVVINGTTGITTPATTSTGNSIISSGNLVIGTAGKGIDFDPAGSGAAANLLDDYEEGNWTPTFSTWTLAPTETIANKYTKVGRVVIINMINRGGTISAGNSIGGLPFSPSGQGASSVLNTNSGTPTAVPCSIDDGTSIIGNLGAATLGTSYWTLSISYIAT